MPANSGKASTASELAAEATGNQITATRIFDAPRDLVFQMWTEPEHISKWWGPKGFTSTIYEMDVRPGGVWRFVMHGPDGRDYQNKIVYVEVVRPERLVYDHVSYPLFRATATFDEQDGKTRVSMRMVFESAALRDQVAKEFGAVEGLDQTLERLREHLAKTPAYQPLPRDLALTRSFDAPRDVVFKAWTDAQSLKRWWGPKGFTNPVCEVDPRPGGLIRIDMRAPDGTVYPTKGMFREIVPPERLVFTTCMLDEKGDTVFEVLNTLTFTQHGGKTTIMLYVSVGKTTTGLERPYLAGMEQGWSESLDKLDQEVAQ